MMIIDLQHIDWEREDRTILRDVNWQVESGQHWCLLGLNGSGKTTLLNMVNGYQWPTRGSIAVLGHTFGTYDLRELRKEIGWVSTSLQQKLYGSDTALNIVLSGRSSSIGIYDTPTDSEREQAYSIMETLRCANLANRTYQTLSQGEKQRVLIGRALMNKPKLLILDEPCTGLDLIAREQLLERINSLSEQQDCPTMIYVTHHVEEILPCFTHTLLLKNGQVFAQGETSTVMTGQCMSAFFEVPIQLEKENERYWLTIKQQ